MSLAMVQESLLQFAPTVVEQALLQLLDSRNTVRFHKLEKLNMQRIKILRVNYGTSVNRTK
jgi:hypothetical protein